MYFYIEKKVKVFSYRLLFKGHLGTHFLLYMAYFESHLKDLEKLYYVEPEKSVILFYHQGSQGPFANSGRARSSNKLIFF